eukprot:4358575-Amphidinium_carterae.1
MIQSCRQCTLHCRARRAYQNADGEHGWVQFAGLTVLVAILFGCDESWTLPAAGRIAAEFAKCQENWAQRDKA